jgi:aminoglycoside/choline kinase family phosphotransferase
METEIKSHLVGLFKKWAHREPKTISALPAHGSYRKYYRISDENISAIGVYNEDRAENVAFLTFSKSFREIGLPVPDIYNEDLKSNIYLEEDLGNITLFAYLSEIRAKEGFSDKIVQIYEKVLKILPKFQIIAAESIDYNVCYPRHSFDRQSMLWDLNYFKYYFLKLAKIAFNEQQLEDDFQKFTEFLLATDCNFFLYRDFQSRNVMLSDKKPFFIDYQGGRKGALQYDVASLLYDAKANIPQEVRDYLLNKYIESITKLIPIKKQRFLEHYYGYTFIRIMQALGAYGFRGFYERKTDFLRSVPYAIQNLELLLNSVKLPVEIPTLTDAWRKLTRSTYLRQLGDAQLHLNVRIQSFAYKRGIPVDEAGHGGGFVLDCRALPNPGKFPEYSEITGNDQEVINFFKNNTEVNVFLENTYNLIDQTISNYQKRNFTDLMVAFGCTGGQHRSVYCTNKLYEYLLKKYNIRIEVRHRELEMIA